MILTLVLLAGVALIILGVTVVSGRKYSLVEPLLAGEATAVGLGDPAAETLNGHNEPLASIQSDWQLTTVSALCDAEGLLDCLEAQGIQERELIVLGNSTFAVRWR